MTRRILVIEDDRDIAHLLELHLRDEGYEVLVAHDGYDGLSLARSAAPHLLILDLMLPGVGGLDVCREIRRGAAYTPILMLTARSTELDRVLGLELGADDYLTKPFSIMELMARVKAVLRRVDAIESRRRDQDTTRVQCGDLTVDLETRAVSVGGRPVALTAREFDLLVHFARHPGRVYTRRELLDKVWGYGHDGYEHTVNSHINRLRGKIEQDPSQPRYVLTVWGVGYKFSDGITGERR